MDDIANYFFFVDAHDVVVVDVMADIAVDLNNYFFDFHNAIDMLPEEEVHFVVVVIVEVLQMEYFLIVVVVVIVDVQEVHYLLLVVVIVDVVEVH